jgi:hypothetical protein
VVCSDETSVRVKGKNWWEWVFIGTLAVLHVINPSRGKAVVTAIGAKIRFDPARLGLILGADAKHSICPDRPILRPLKAASGRP